MYWRQPTSKRIGGRGYEATPVSFTITTLPPPPSHPPSPPQAKNDYDLQQWAKSGPATGISSSTTTTATTTTSSGSSQQQVGEYAKCLSVSQLTAS